MTIHRIRMLGDPILRTRCEPIAKPGSAAVRVIIDDLRDTLRDFQSRFGYGRALAAPQIGAPVRIVFVEMEKPWALINPEIVDVDNEDFTVWDDCFSFPNLLVRVSRAFRIKVRYQDVKGEWLTVDLEEIAPNSCSMRSIISTASWRWTGRTDSIPSVSARNGTGNMRTRAATASRKPAVKATPRL